MGIGDILCTNGMVNFLLNYYDKIFILCPCDNTLKIFKLLYKNNNKVNIIISYWGNFEISEEYLDKNIEFDGINLFAEGQDPYNFRNRNFIKNVYDINKPIGNSVGLQKNNYSDFITFYSIAGIPEEIKINYFNFDRLYDYENKLFDSLNISSKYSIICEYGNNLIQRKYINYQNRIINLHNISSNYFDVVKLIENASEVHLINNSISLLVYLLQITGRMKLVPVKLHSYARMGEVNSENIINFYEKHNFLKPKLDNWEFVY